MLGKLFGRVPKVERRHTVRETPERAREIEDFGTRIDNGLQRLSAAADSIVKEGTEVVGCLTSAKTPHSKFCFTSRKISTGRG